MTHDSVRRALGLASDGVPTPDGLAEKTWLRGRRVRRRRTLLGGAGTAAVVGVTALAWGALGPGVLPDGRDVIPAGTSTAPTATAPESGPESGSETAPALLETAPEPDPDATDGTDVVPVEASAETQRVWGVLRAACLGDRGYEVVVNGSSLTATQRGAQAGDYTRDTALCDAELMMRLPPVDVSVDGGELSAAADAALRAVYASYVVTARCVQAAGMPVDEAPPAEEFVDRFAREWMPSWHPWTAAAVSGDYARVRSTCPVGRP